MKIVFASHVALIDGKEYDGIGNVIKKTLAGLVDNYVFVRNSIDGRLSSQVQYYQGEKMTDESDLGVISKPSPLRYVSEIMKTVRYFSRKNEIIDVYIGIDPLNALAGLMLQRKGLVKKAIFYTADYSPHRFSNPALNWVYHAIDKYCVSHADEVWSVSTRICEVRREMGLAEERNIFLPNVPPVEYDHYRHREHDRYELITTGILDRQLDFKNVLKAMSQLKDEFPNISLTIIGNGPQEGNIKNWAKQVGVADRVDMPGRLPLDETLEKQSTAGIGLALYTGVWGFNKYGDSTKCREYFNFGLPVLSTDTHSTVDDIRKYGAGRIVSMSTEEYVSALRDIFANYDAYSQKSSKLGERYSGVHRAQLQRVMQQ